MQDNQAGAQSPKCAIDVDLQSALVDLLDLEWAEVEANSNSTFIQLGGNSVKALELTFRLDAAGKSLDVETILDEESSISLLSRGLQQDSDDASGFQATPLTESDTDVQSPCVDSNDPLASVSSDADLDLVKEASHRLACPDDAIENILTLTSQQRGLWLGSLQIPGAYISRWQFRLAHDTDQERLKDAWRRILKIHPILRTRILSFSDSIFRQIVLTNEHYRDQEHLWHQKDITADEGAPLFSFDVETHDKYSVLNLVCHHVLYDRWSMNLILRDVRLAYHHHAELDPPTSYVPFLQPLSESSVAALLDSWRDITQDETVVSAPIVRASHGFPLASHACEVVVTPSIVENATLAELIAAAWSLVCSKHTGSPCVSFGLTVWGRDAPVRGITNMAFPTFNTLPLISRISESDTIDSLLKQIKSRLNIVRRAQRLDIETIASVNSACRDSCRFNSILVIQQDTSTKRDGGMFDPEHLLSFETTQSASLVLECTPTGKDIVFRMKYDSIFISPVEAEIMLHHLRTAFGELSSNTDRQLDEISLFNERDLQYVNKWVIPSLSLERTTLHSLVEESAKTRPDSLAIWQTDLSLSYSALIQHSRKVMTKILALSKGTSPNIGVCFEKSAYAIVAMLGISMAGHVFVPMDASNPFNRLMKLVENADMDLVICSRSMSSYFQKAGINTIVVDRETIIDATDGGETVSSNPESNVYIIYTSGSTGEPKGVTMTHQALCTTLIAISEHLEFSDDTKTLQFSSFAFDMSVHDIWCTLLKGGVVCIPTDTERFELEEYIPRSGCNYAMLTPSVALTLSENSWKSFDRLSTSGEPLPKAVFQSALKAGVKFWNTYGPTESCIICITEQIKTMDTSPARLGYSMAATSWIIDANDPHRLAPIGCVGELALTGHTLAAGYYRDAQKTEQIFVADLEWTKQFPDHPLDRVYRTGDLAKYQSDGSIEFHGRLGGYIKIAGNRVDLGEIEYVLHSKCNLPKVSVQYCKVGTTETRDILVSFCAYPSKRTGEASELLPMANETKKKSTEGFLKLKELLPSFMIPAVFVPISRFPYNTAGKLDKKRLIGLIAEQSVGDLLATYGIETQATHASQDDSDEETLSSRVLIMRDSWAKVLKTTPGRITSRSNFFRLGGDSLRAMNLGANLRKDGHSISASDIFKFPVLSDMASRMKDAASKDSEVISKDIWNPGEEDKISATAAKALNLSRQQIQSVLPCTSLQAQMLAASAQSPSTYLHRECFELTPELRSSEITEVCQSLVSRNELLRSKAFIDQETGQLVLAILHPSMPISLSHRRGSLQQYIESGPEPLGIEHDLARFVILEGSQNRILIWEMHHCIFDGYSNNLLRQQIRDIILEKRHKHTSSDYEARNAPDFKNFVQYIKNADRQEATQFWSGYLRDAPEPSLPFGRSGNHIRATNTKTTRELECEIPLESKFTSAVYIRAAFALTLSQYTTSLDVLFAATNHGRDLPVRDIDKLAGPTFSTLPVRCIIDRNSNLEALLSRFQVEAAEIASYQYMSTEEISSVSVECKQACRFLMHLLIQPDIEASIFKDLEDIGYRAIPDVSPMNLQIPFNLVATARSKSIQFDMIYNDELFSSKDIDLFFDQFSSNLIGILNGDEKMLVGDICDLGDMNRRAYLTIQPHEADGDRYAGLTIPELVFRDHLGARANDTALYSTTTTFTYREVYELASALGEEISSQVGTSNSRYVPVCYEKSPAAIIAQLAVLMAGCAYVSIDASWPVARRAAILRQIDSKLLILSKSTSNLLHDVAGTVIMFDVDNARRQAIQSEKTLSRAKPEDAAYVIFTSGTTGLPKSVVVQHDAICRTVSAYAERLKFSCETRSLLFASFSFDASVMETWSVLAAGGTLCIADDDERISDLDGFLVRSQVDCVGLTPTSAMLLDPSRHDAVKTLLFCGEKCQTKDLTRWTSLDLTLVNGYGPSETSVNAVMNTNFSAADLDDIGSSMGGGLWIVDSDNHDQIVPVGAVGELLVTGPVLAKEYLHDPERTAQKFVYPKWPSWTKTTGQKAYKTGDLVRLDTNGQLRFVGRHDGQMKINGIRIESDEIESAAIAVCSTSNASISISETVAGLFSSNDENQELAIFFVPSDDKTTSSQAQILPLQQNHHQAITELHKHLTSVLPRTHLPSLYVPISAVPSSSSGKTDRKALSQALALLHPAQINLYRPQNHSLLRSPDDTTTTTTTGPVSLSERTTKLTPTETTLLSLWTQILHIQPKPNSTPLTRKSHFIRTGGDSISAIRLSSLARSKGIDLPVSLIYSNPVLADMAVAVDDRAAVKDRRNGEGEGRSEGGGMFDDDLVSPQPFELIRGMDLSPDSPMYTRDQGKGRDDYFGSLTV